MSGVDTEDPRCPECGEPIGITATYCMHCSADLTEEPIQSADENWSDTNEMSVAQTVSVSTEDTVESEPEPGPDGVENEGMEALIGLIGGIIIGLIMLVVLSSKFSPVLGLGLGILLGFVVGFSVWLCASIYLILRGTVQEAITKTATGIAFAFLTVPLVFYPIWEASGQIRTVGGVCAVFAVLIRVGGFFAKRSVSTSQSEV